MASGCVQDFAKKTRKRNPRKRKLRKNFKIFKSAVNYGPYFCKKLEKLHPGLTLSRKAVSILNSFESDMFERIASEASWLMNKNNRKTIKPADVHFATRLLLPPNLAKEAKSIGIKAVIEYYKSRKEANITNASEMADEKSDKELWLKCYSKKKNMIYYWNCNTRESVWESDATKIVGKSNVTIVDKTEDMKNGEVPEVYPGLEANSTPKSVNTARAQLYNGNSSVGKSRAESEDDDDDFNDSLKAYYESSTSSSSIVNSSRGSVDNNHTGGALERRYSDRVSNPSVAENVTSGRKSSEILPKVGLRCARNTVSCVTNYGKRKSSNGAPPTLPKRPSQAYILQPKKATEKSSTRDRFRTPIQDRKMKEKEELLKKQKQKNCQNEAQNLPDIVQEIRRAPLLTASQPSNSGDSKLHSPSGAPLPATSHPPSNGDNKAHKLGRFVIPRRRVRNYTSEGDSGGESQLATTPQMPPQVPQAISPLLSPIRAVPSNVRRLRGDSQLAASPQMPPQVPKATSPLLSPTRAVPNNVRRLNHTASPKDPLPISALPIIRTVKGCRLSDEENNKRKSDSDGASAGPKKTRVSTKTSDGASTGFAPPSAGFTSSRGSAPFDARQVLEMRRSNRQKQVEMQSKPSCSAQDDLAMEWEAIDSAEEGSNRSVKDRLTLNSLTQSSSLIMKRLEFKPLVIVCDTNALIHYIELVEELLCGFLLGIPVKLVIPLVVFRELDSMKQYTEHFTGEGARAAIRLIHKITVSESTSECNLTIQDSNSNTRKAKENLELETNDDYILNCALQEKILHGDNKTVILLTADRHLQVLAQVEKITSASPVSLKKWARDYKEKVRLEELGVNMPGQLLSSATPSTRLYESPHVASRQHPATNMDIDPDPSFLPSSAILPISVDSSYQPGTEAKRNIGAKFYAESLNDDLLQFLINVIKVCNEREYKHLKEHASQPRPSWTLVQCLANVVRRWNILTQKNLPRPVHENIKRIIELVKKCNRGLEEFTKSDMKTYFLCSEILAKEFESLYVELSGFFLTRLAMLREEWEVKYMRRSSSMGSLGSLSDEEDKQPADLALQTIYSCMQSDYGIWKERAEVKCATDNENIKKGLKTFHTKVTNMLRILVRTLDESESSHYSLTVHDDCIHDFLKETTLYKAETGNLISFELTEESIVALFESKHLRKGVEEVLCKLRKLQSDVVDLLEELNSDSDDLDFD